MSGANILLNEIPIKSVRPDNQPACILWGECSHDLPLVGAPQTEDLIGVPSNHRPVVIQTKLSRLQVLAATCQEANQPKSGQ
jgi:hypothetical protein